MTGICYNYSNILINSGLRIRYTGINCLLYWLYLLLAILVIFTGCYTGCINVFNSPGESHDEEHGADTCHQGSIGEVGCNMERRKLAILFNVNILGEMFVVCWVTSDENGKKASADTEGK